VTGTFECGNEPSGSTKFGEFLDYLKTGLRLKKDSAAWSKSVTNFTQCQCRFCFAMCKMNDEYKLECLETKVTGKTVLCSRVEPKTLHKL
jgi:hypothetical protein